MKRIVQLFAVLLAAWTITSCGGGQNSPGTPASGRGSTRMTITWPPRSTTSRKIPIASNSIVVTISQGTTVLQTQTVPRPANTNTSSVTFNNLPIVPLTLAASAYPSTDGTGVAQATASVMVTPINGQTVTVPVVLISTIKTLSVNAPHALAYGQSVQLIVTAKDADGNVVMLSTNPSTLTFSTSNANVVKVSAIGEITGVAQNPVPLQPASAVITITDTDSGTSTTVTVYIVPNTGQKVFIADTGNNQIIEADQFLDYPPIAMFGTPGTGNGQFNVPWTIAVGPDNRIYVVDQGNGRITRMDDMTGANFKAFGTTGSGTNQFLAAEAICIDANSRIYVADTGNNRVVRFDDMSGTNWTVLTAAAGKAFVAPAGVAVDALGRLYIADGGNNRVVRVDDITGVNPLTNNPVIGLNDPAQLQILPNQYIAVTDEGNDRIIVLDGLQSNAPQIYLTTHPVSKIFTTECSNLGIKGDHMALPEAGVFGADGTLYVADTNLNRIDIIFSTDEDACLWTDISPSNYAPFPFPVSGSQGLTVVNIGP